MKPTSAAHVLSSGTAAFRLEPLLLAMLLLAPLLAPLLARAADSQATESPEPPPSKLPVAPPPPAPKDTTLRFYVQEYRVQGGGHLLTRDETEAAVYPFMGPYRTPADVEAARAALEQAYHDKGYQTVTVSIPAQHARTGIIILQVAEGTIARLTVNGSRYFSIDEIKREAPSLQEGTSPNFSQVRHDLVVLNQLSDRQVTPAIRPGEVPGTVDVDLNVKDTFPLHGSLEINNRYSADTTALRINGAVNYDNLWQMGHGIGFSFQLSPEDLTEVKVFSGYYLIRLPNISWLSFMVQGTDQDSNVNTLGGIGVVGKGEILGGRALFSLPQIAGSDGKPAFFQSLSLGIDRKRFTQLENLGEDNNAPLPFAPVTYYPISAAYSSTWLGKGYETDFNASVNFNVRGWGSDEDEFEINRHGADGSFIYFRGDLSTPTSCPRASRSSPRRRARRRKPRWSTARNSAAAASARCAATWSPRSSATTPSAPRWSCARRRSATSSARRSMNGASTSSATSACSPSTTHCRSRTPSFKLASVGAGTRVRLDKHYNGSLDVGIPLDNGVNTNAYEPLLTFRVWAEF